MVIAKIVSGGQTGGGSVGTICEMVRLESAPFYQLRDAIGSLGV